MIEEAYVSFETAKLLRDKGFEEVCSAHYEDYGIHQPLYITARRGAYNIAFKQRENLANRFNLLKERYKCAAPTQQMAMRWLREEYNIFISIQPDFPSEQDYKLCWCWSANILHENCINTKGYQCYIETYEKACEAALLYSLENLVAPKENNE